MTYIPIAAPPSRIEGSKPAEISSYRGRDAGHQRVEARRELETAAA
jgi:hypothetical protein